MSAPVRTTLLLQRMQDGDAGAAQELLPVVYEELHRLAARAMGRQNQDHTLQATALLNEAWIRLVEAEGGEWNSRNHFLAVAAKAMRSVLVDHARRRGSEKRGGTHGRVELDRALGLFEQRSTDLLALDDALGELAQMDPILARIVELRFFGGLKNSEIAELEGCSLRTVERGWSTARAWLYQRLDKPRG
ncbi:MAG: sigma-70 family RNA polymerase sigma factor [bacterium]|nr:sigma-70 family RNA polymerase sigma factor [bacterium]